MSKGARNGLFAAAAVILLPLLLCGMGMPPTKGLTGGKPVGAQSQDQRYITEFVIHQEMENGEELVTVTVSGEEREMTMEDYLTGVLMGEMPASFQMEALKAQAVAARTYTMKRLASGGTLSDDPSVCQAFISPEKAQEKLGSQWEQLLRKLRQAVTDTEGQVLTYDGDLISATYFSCSGGRTESAQAVWGGDVPYLISVESPGEEECADYETTKTMTREAVMDALMVDSLGVSDVTYTEGGGVDTMVIGGKTFSGRELRGLLGLKSTCFTMELTEKEAIFTVRGYGHRVGLSQEGAEAMALEGKDYREILQWYYPGTELVTE
ncbi:MAG: stage II sporulation protein D [Oscillospiraceae bacterium]|nr:stage II sporulation protein D [Oscillospiraceae bacterium]